MCFVEQEGAAPSLRGMAEVIETQGLPSSLYTGRGSHYRPPPKPAARSIAPAPPSSGAPCASSAWR